MTMPKRLDRALRQIVAEVDAMPDPPAVLTTYTAVVADHLAAEDRRRARHDAAQAHRDAKAQQGGRMWSRRRQDPPELIEGRRAVAARAGGRCEAGASPDCTGRHEHTHHRRGRQCRGAHAPGMLLAVCRPCHDWIHAHPAAAREAGWMVSRLGGEA